VTFAGFMAPFMYWEVGDRFQNMYFAAKNGNWGLAFHMSNTSR
jgi:hypothetical protein